MTNFSTYSGKIFVSCDGASTWGYFLLMRAWQQTDGTPFNIVYPQSVDYDENVMRDSLINSDVFVLLVGDSTRYSERNLSELRTAIILKKCIIVMNLNGLRHRDKLRCPSELRETASLHISFAAKIFQYALYNWSLFLMGNNDSMMGYYFYSSDVYASLGM